MERVKNLCKNRKRSQMYNLMTVNRNTCSIEFNNIYKKVPIFKFNICDVNFNWNGKVNEVWKVWFLIFWLIKRYNWKFKWIFDDQRGRINASRNRRLYSAAVVKLWLVTSLEGSRKFCWLSIRKKFTSNEYAK